MRTTRGGSQRVWSLAALLIVGVAATLSQASAPPITEEVALRLKALALNHLTGTAAMNAQLDRFVADPAGTRKLFAVAVRMAQEKPLPLGRNALLVLAQTAGELKEVDASIAFYRQGIELERALGSESGIAAAYLGMLSVYNEAGKYAEAEKLYKEFEALESDEDGVITRFKPQLFQRLVLFMATRGALDRALKIVDERIRISPRNWALRAFRARVYRAADKLDEAVKNYQDVIERIKKDPKLEDEEKDDYIDVFCRSDLSDVYIDLGQIDKATEQLKALLARHPNNPSYHNTLGYIWADRGMNLPEAEKLIRRAIELDRKLRHKANPDLKPELDRDNAAYLDSLGWVLFKQGKAKEAKSYLLEAVKDREGQNIEIYDHLGDVHLALGEKDEALAAWKKGLEVVSPTSKREQKIKAEVQKKIEKHGK